MPEEVFQGVIPDHAAQHVHHPRTFLIGLARRHLPHVRELVMDDAVVRIPGVEVEDTLLTLLEAAHEVVAPVRVFAEEQREVCREPLAQPYIVPVGFGDGVAPPLVRDLVDDDVPDALGAPPRDEVLAVENRGRGSMPPPTLADCTLATFS